MGLLWRQRPAGGEQVCSRDRGVEGLAAVPNWNFFLPLICRLQEKQHSTLNPESRTSTYR